MGKHLIAISAPVKTGEKMPAVPSIDLTGGTASNWFSSVVTPEGWTLSTDGLLAIPEPASLLLALIGLALLLLRRRQ